MVFCNTYSVLLSERKNKLRFIFTQWCYIRTFTRHKRLNHFLGFRWRWTLCFDIFLQWYHLFYAIQPVLSNMLIGSNQDVMSPNRSIFKSHSKSTSTWRKQLYNQTVSLSRKSVPSWSSEIQFIFHKSPPLNTILNQLTHLHPILVHFDNSFPIHACISKMVSSQELF